MNTPKYTGKIDRKLIIATNRRLQETMQKLFMAKQELEKKNKEVEKARQMEHRQNEQLQNEINALKHLARPFGTRRYPKGGGKKEISAGQKLTKSIAEGLSLKYISIVESYVSTKDLEKVELLVEELCLRLLEYGVTPKGVVSIHLKAVPQIKTIGDLETKRVTFESRMVLLKVMTHYAALLMRNQSADNRDERI